VSDNDRRRGAWRGGRGRGCPGWQGCRPYLRPVDGYVCDPHRALGRGGVQRSCAFARRTATSERQDLGSISWCRIHGADRAPRRPRQGNQSQTQDKLRGNKFRSCRPTSPSWEIPWPSSGHGA